MTTKLKKWGNSYGVRIPKDVLDNLEISENVEFDINMKGKKIELVPKQISKPKYSLNKLCNSIKNNTHKEVEWGGSIGNEIW